MILTMNEYDLSELTRLVAVEAFFTYFIDDERGRQYETWDRYDTYAAGITIAAQLRGVQV